MGGELAPIQIGSHWLRTHPAPLALYAETTPVVVSMSDVFCELTSSVLPTTTGAESAPPKVATSPVS